MGLEITATSFSKNDYLKFSEKLRDNLAALEDLTGRPKFGQPSVGSPMVGAELEMYIIDKQGLPLCLNQELLKEAEDPQLTLELNRYNLEYNLTPYAINEQAFASTEQEMQTQLDKLGVLADAHQGRIVPIGILPTLAPEHFGPEFLTGRKRYHALVEQLLKHRGGDFQIDINGESPLNMAMSDVTLEGANTSFQIHYRVSSQCYADTFNAVQLITAPLIAIAANSPGLFGHSLWHETRVPLFKQAIDTRDKDRYQWHEPARVNFGHGWVRESALELFRETVNLYPPLLPICGDVNPQQEIENAQVPQLQELRLHQGTVWPWNRPVYDDADGGHLRIEMRALPAGPTPVDMAANAAFYIGLAESLKGEMSRLTPALPFHLAEYNFYRAAQFGLDAKILWPSSEQTAISEYPVADIIEQCIPRARAGLQTIGVSETEIDKYLGVIGQRLRNKQTGAMWQQQRIKSYLSSHDNRESHHLMLEDYVKNSRCNIPVGEWS